MPKTYTPIATQTLSTPAAFITFSSVPATYTDLVLVSNNANSVGNGYLLKLEFNSDTGTNYSAIWLRGDGSTATSQIMGPNTELWVGWGGAALSTFVIQIQDYANSTTYKTLLARWGVAAYRLGASVGLWRSTAAITSIKVSSESPSNFITGSTFTLYGILKA